MSTELVRDYGGMGLAAGFVSLGAWALSETARMSALGMVFPRTIAAAMIVFALVYMAFAYLRPGGHSRPQDRESTWRRVSLVGLMLGWTVVMPFLGFVISSLVAVVLLSAVANYDRWTPLRMVLYPATGIFIVALFYLLFAYALKVPLPEGSLLSL